MSLGSTAVAPPRPGVSPRRPGLAATSPFLRAAAGDRPDSVPVWFMRQAGRVLPEYRALRATTAMLDSCRNADMVTEITLQPVRRFRPDAAIFFSDIVLPLAAVGVDVDIVAGVGPVVAHPVRAPSDLDVLRPLEPGDVPYVSEAVASLVRELGQTPLIGFAGAPFTLASYLIEGGPSRSHTRTKALMYAEPVLWHDLLGRLADITAAFLRVQVDAGADAIQLFDSWAGALSEDDYLRYVAPHSTRVLAAFADDGIPRIHFGVNTGELLGAMGAAGADVVGVDWRVPLDEAARRVGPGRAVQGNLDPAAVFAPSDVLAAKVRDVCRRGAAAPGHIFNFGHGVLPESDPGVLAHIVDLVHQF
ncbi:MULTISPECIES: uroporphyrinogen decarboxylase [unclassified Parafrankia]|uniref:uroporphyrinogen decarboxylase n=1 Tax=unclassified Parafrankia TaxID=2994368 RepID=UPI000DA494D3|nr:MULTISPECIES: uroporphyrinogen decarboxylase [unclassified Parafrankia]TCJ36166.1 uroporphyrinogen decarboxylase [Parafrankia sp. BMG5.11]CAI7977872.1 uroporphyrinogen III decarboxylase [Frankia sp. Hr75.2]SQD98795.1 uroporphyrinogen III decarboxylase [Parafrankia sp. Ea1.12]